MKKILIQTPSPHLAGNVMFNAEDIAKMSDHWRELKLRFLSLGYDFVTADNNSLNDCAWILFLDSASVDGLDNQWKRAKSYLKKLLKIRGYQPWPIRPLYQEAIKQNMGDNLALFLWEAKVVNQNNYNQRIWGKFKYIFTWDDDLVDNKKFFKFFLPTPNHTPLAKSTPFNQKKLIVNMTNNKYSAKPNELYSARRKTIGYFDSNFPDDFDLFGNQWNKPVTKWQKRFPWLVKKHTSYRGGALKKIETLSRYKFTLCYENVSDVKGYVTEKIFDALHARTIPIYWGATNVDQFVDADTFLDRRKFKNDEDLAKYLKQMTEENYNKYLAAGARYLQSEKYAKFLPENFCDQIIKALNLKPII